MDTFALTEIGRDCLARAREASSGRHAVTVVGGRDRRLRQTLLALTVGHGLDEHENPGEATLQVLSGRILLRTSSDGWELGPGELHEIPDETHAVDVLEDAVFLLTVSK